MRNRTTLRTIRTPAGLLAVGALLLTIVLGSVLPAAATAGAAPVRASHARVSWMPHIGRTIVPTRAQQLGPQLATWYGPGFFGHGTACGQTLRASTWGIAHRTLPCGTLVTISYGSRTVTVPVIDRGPYSGASVDLTSRTKQYLHFTSGRIRMSKVQHYRLVPLPKPVSGIVAVPAAKAG